MHSPEAEQVHQQQEGVVLPAEGAGEGEAVSAASMSPPEGGREKGGEQSSQSASRPPSGGAPGPEGGVGASGDGNTGADSEGMNTVVGGEGSSAPTSDPADDAPLGREAPPTPPSPPSAPVPSFDPKFLVEDDVIGHVPSYAMPNISSMLPNYMNSEQEFIFRTFNVGNYDMLKHLPENFREQQVCDICVWTRCVN